jgi:capsular exopolysaccharide synthesis family protein
MELSQYLRLFRKWAWLILLAALIGGAIAYYVRRNEADTYQAQTKILIGTYLEASNPDAVEIRTGAELAKTYAELAKTRNILQPVIDQLDLDATPAELAGSITIELIPETSMMVLTVINTDPLLAADIANTVAAQLVANSPTNLTDEQQETIRSAREQISLLNSQILGLRQRLTEIGQRIDQAVDQDEILRLQAQYDITTSRISQDQQTVADFQQTIAALQQRTNALEVVEEALAPDGPVDKGVMRTGMLGAIIGILLATALVLGINYQENTIKSTDQASDVLDLPVVGAITQFGRTRDAYPQRLIARLAPKSPPAETYQALQANLLFTTNGQTKRKGVYVFTSPGMGEGKSVTVANLAVTIASTGTNVLLIDADLRQPSLHEFLGLENKGYLSALLTTPPNEVLGTNGKHGLPALLAETVQATEIPNLRVITSGPLPDIPAEVLHSEHLPEWVRTFHSLLDVDVILFDTPPCLLVADSAILAANLRAKVVLVVEAGKTPRTAALKAKDQFNHIGSDISGIVLNKANPDDQGVMYGNYTKTRV